MEPKVIIDSMEAAYKKGKQDTLTELLESLPKKKLPIMNVPGYDEKVGFNQALFVVQDLIKSKLT